MVRQYRPKGLMWVLLLALLIGGARPLSVARADGRWRRVSAPENPNPAQDLLSNDIRALAYDPAGGQMPRLWVGSDLGLQTYDGRNWQDFSAPAGVDNADVTALLSVEGALWVGTPGGLNLRLPSGTWQNAVLEGEVRALADGGSGVVYVGMPDSVWLCRLGEGDVLDCSVQVPELNQVRALLVEDGELWVGTGEGVMRLVGLTLIPYSTADGLISDQVTSLVLDGQDRLWIGTERGITRYAETARVKWHSFLTQPVRSLAVDSRDRVWAATDGGLLKWDPRWEQQSPLPDTWQRLDTRSGELRGEAASLVYSRPQGMLWVVTPSGLSAVEGNWDTYDESQVLPGEDVHLGQVTSLFYDQATGRLWAGSEAGVSRYLQRADAWEQTWTAAEGIEGPVRALAGSAVGSAIWAATDGGVFALRADGSRWDRVGAAGDGVAGSAVLALAPDSAGTWWAGTARGLYRYDAPNGRWTPIWPVSGESAVYVIRAEPQTGTLWLATGLGVVRYDQALGRAELFWPLGSDGDRLAISDLLRDPSTEEMWMAVGGRIRYYDGAAWRRDAFPDLEGVQVLAYDARHASLLAGTADGLYAYAPGPNAWQALSTGVGRFAGKAVRSLSTGQGGDLWAGSDGLVAHMVDAAPIQPWVRLTLAFSDGTSLLYPTQPIKLLGLDDIRYQFEGASFVAELGDLRYAYQIPEIDPAARWTTPAQGLEAVYTALPFGTYTLNLWAIDNQGAESAVMGYPLAVQARPVVTLTEIMGTAVPLDGSLAFSIRPRQSWPLPMRTIPFTLRWTDADGLQDLPGIQAGWFDAAEEQTYVVRAGDTLPPIADAFGLSYQALAQYNGISNSNPITVGQTLRIPAGSLPDTMCPAEVVEANCWLIISPVEMTEDEAQGRVPIIDVGGTYRLQIRAVDADGNASLRHAPITFEVKATIDLSRFLPWIAVGALVLLLFAAGYALRAYPDYAASWGAAYGSPVQQLIPLVAPLNDTLDIPRVQAALQKRQAFTTPDQVQAALEGLVRSRILVYAEGGGYRFAHPFVAWLHRLRSVGRRDTLAETVRSRHPLYAGARSFFTQAGFAIQDLSPEAFLLSPASDPHPQASYGTIYTRLVAGQALDGESFEEIYQAARVLYGNDVRHRLAFVVINRRPTPGARLRLYEIRQTSGLAIVTLDSELFGQVKPNMPAGNILAAQIDQATGRQDLYALSGPVSDDLSFFGRETVMQQVIDLIDAGQPVGIFGLRKTGKTSLLQRLRGHLALRRVIAAVDTQGTAREQGVLSLYPAVIGAFVAHIRQYRSGLTRSIPPLHLWPMPRGRTLSPEIARVFADDLLALHRLIGGDERLLLILDEVDRLLPTEEDPGYEGFSTFFGQLRAANQGLQVLDLIVAGVDPAINRRDRWGERDNELYQALREVWMPSMRTAAVREMIESIGFQMGIQYAPEALERLILAGGGHPFLTRQICSQVVGGLLDRGTAIIDEERAQAGIEAYAYLPDSYLTELWRVRLDPAQQALLLHLARADTPVARTRLLPDEQRQSALATLGALEEQTVVCRLNGDYVIGWGILRDWIRWIELGLED